MVNPKLIPDTMGTAKFGIKIEDVGGDDVEYQKKKTASLSQKKEEPHGPNDDLCTRQITVEGTKAHGMCGTETVYGKAVVGGDKVVFKQGETKKLNMYQLDGTNIDMDAQ